MKFLWEIIVPGENRIGNPIADTYHQLWDKEVTKIAGGLTIYKPGKGYWAHRDRNYIERMIPVKILCTRKQLDKIIDLTIKHYDQEAVAAYLVSKKFIIRKKGDAKKKKALYRKKKREQRTNKLRSVSESK